MSQTESGGWVRRVSASHLTSSQLAEYGISEDEAAFLLAVVKAVNGELPGYSLLDSMGAIRSQYTVNEPRLFDAGYLKVHLDEDDRVYYTVTPEGQRAVRAQQKFGFMDGDLGDDTPHRVGVELMRRWLSVREDTQWVEVSRRESCGGVSDVAAFAGGGVRVATVEVEGGRVPRDPGVDVTASAAGTNNYESVRKDYDLLAGQDGRSVWVVRSCEVAGTVLRALGSHPGAPTFGRGLVEDVESGEVGLAELSREHLGGDGCEGLDALHSFGDVRGWLGPYL